MISPSEAEYGVVEHLVAGAKKLGFKPFNNITFISESEDGSGRLTGICPLCGHQKTFESLDELDATKEITNPNGNLKFIVNSCETCAASRKESVSGDPQRPLNALLYVRARDVLENKFNSKLIPTKSNLFVSPEEYVTFKPNTENAEKYKIKLKIVMLYADIHFEDLDTDEGESVFEIEESELNAILKRDETVTVPFEDFLVNKERDSLEFVERDEETSEPETAENKENESEVQKTEEPSSGEIAEESTVETTDKTEADEPATEEIKVETEITEDDIQNNEFSGSSEEVTIEPEVQETEVEPETAVEESNDTTGETETVELGVESSDETEITEDDIQNNEFGGSSEEVTIEPEVQETEITEEEKSSESGDGEITLGLDNTETKSESSNNSFDFFGNLFGKKDEEPKEETTEKVVETTNSDNGEITLGLGEDENPFSEASGEISDESENNVVSPITSEARKELESNDSDEEEISLESVDENVDNDEEITIGLNIDKKEKSEKNIESETNVNHKDFIKDEAKKVSDADKKWYSNSVVFDDNDEDDNFNELMDEVDLVEEFKASDLGKVIYEVCKRTGVNAKFTISEDTFEIPVVDFESGIRVICIDCNKVGQMKVQLALMERSVEFAYPLPEKTAYSKYYLYSDCLTTKERTKATIKNLNKIVNKQKFDGRRIINLAGNYTLFYTDSIPVIRAFEAENSSYPQGKPCTKEIGIIALRHRSGKHEQFTAKDFMNYLNKNYKMDMKNHNLYMVATARYIVKPDPQSKTVKYQITDYCELADSILKDGFDHIVGAIIKEHKTNNTVKDPRFLGTDFSQYKYQFEFELDPSTLPSPSLEIWWDNDEFFKMFDSYEDGQGKCYIRVPEYRTNTTDGFRKDPRLFLPIPFSKLFKVDIEKSGVNVLNDNTRRKFIEQLGFVESYYPRMRHFLLHPGKTLKLEFTSSVAMMSKVDLNKFFSGNGVYDGGYDNILLQKFINSSKLDENTKKVMSIYAMSKMLAK